MSRTGEVWFRFMGWNMRSPTLTPWGRRRWKQIALVRKYRPGVWCAVEVGSPVHAAWISARLLVGSHRMRRAPKGGKWRYIWYDPKKVHRIVRSGLYTITSKWNGDAKQAAWAVAEMRNGHECIFVAAHLENKGSEANKVAQMADVIALVERLRKTFPGIPRSRVFIYVDCNSTGAVQRWIEKSAYSSLMYGSAHVGTGWTSQTRWLPRKGLSRLVRPGHPSMDVLASGDERNATKVQQPDAHDISDHDPLIADIEAL